MIRVVTMMYAAPSDQEQNGEINKVVFHAANSFIWREYLGY